MTDALDPTVPAGWYPDPWGSASQRWWDGSSWSANLYPQPEAPTDAAATDSLPTRVAADEDYVPVAVRSTFEPASSYRTAAAPVTSPYPSRRALRELVHPAADEGSAPAMDEDAPSTIEENVMTDLADAPVAEPQASRFAPVAEPQASRFAPVVESLPAYTQAPEFSPEPASALAAPVWVESEPAAEVPDLPVAEVPVAAPSAAEVPAAEAPPVTRQDSAPVGSAVDDGWAASLSRWDDVEASSSPPDALPIFGDAPPVSYSQRAVRYQPLHGRTSPVWLIVFMPILQGVALVGSIFLFPALTSGQQLGALAPIEVMMPILLGMRDWMLFAVLPLTIAFFIFTLIMGFQDRSRLRLLGHDQTASPWWVVLSPLVYLIVRSVRVRQCTGRRGSGPLTTYICLYIAPPIAIVVAGAVASALYGAIPA